MAPYGDDPEAGEMAREGAIEVSPFVEADRAGCAVVLSRLPHWFGFADVNAEYVASLGRRPAWVARRDGAIAGFIAVEGQTAASAEIVVLAVVPELHRGGAGSALLRAAKSWLRQRGFHFVYLLTLGPSDPDQGYARTRLLCRAGLRAAVREHGVLGRSAARAGTGEGAGMMALVPRPATPPRPRRPPRLHRSRRRSHVRSRR